MIPGKRRSLLISEMAEAAPVEAVVPAEAVVPEAAAQVAAQVELYLWENPWFWVRIETCLPL